jgi:hypothetical protein
MGIVDLFRPKYRHSDVRVRTEAVRALTADDAAILVQVARSDRDIGVRRLALEKIEEADVLAELAAAETERSLRELAGGRAARLWVSTACADEDEAADALSGIIKLGDQHALADVAINAAQPALRKRAFGELRDPRALAELAKGEGPQDLRLAAVARIDDGDVLRALAIDTTYKEVGLAAVEKLDDKDRLENVANKAKNKAVRQRARKVVQEIAEAEEAKKPGVSDEVKRKKAEAAQLVREVEAVADSFDFAKVSETIRAAEAAWDLLAMPDDERFRKATQRFWKRKQVHDEQTRTSQELRAVEREVKADKERAAQAAAPAPAPAPNLAIKTQFDDLEELVTKPEMAIEDPRKAEREAEKQRRVEEAAERDRRKQEDAERGASIAASLGAMCEDMEKLAESKDARAIDRVLQQAGKAFDQIGKVPAADRDTLGDRYSAARGKLVVRSKELREAEDWARFQNVPKAEALIATAKAMLDEPASQDLGNRLRQMQALWKEVGAMPQRRSKELWEQFKAICDQIYDKVKGVRAVEAEKFVEVAKVKEALIAEAEVLAESTDWAATADKLKALQAKWKDSGHLPRKQGDELWKRFRAACDRFFERRKPVLDERHAEEAKNLEAKHALIARASAVADAAPGDGGWGKAIAEIKELQREWKDVGFVPRRDADTVWRAFRRACDSLFEKRDASRDTEANAHRAELDAARAELAAVVAAPAGEEGIAARAVAARDKASEVGGGALAKDIEAMVRHVIATHAEALKGSELDPVALRARREKLIVKVEELLPKQPTAVSAEGAPVDIAAQLKQAMRANAFGALRFSGRDPIEVVDEMRSHWTEYGPILDDEDRAQAARFETACKRVLEAAGPAERFDEATETGTRDERGARPKRKRRDRVSGEITVSVNEAVTVPVNVPNIIAPARVSVPAPESVPSAAPVMPMSKHDAITQPAQLPFQPVSAPPVPAVAAPTPAEAERAKSASVMPPMDDVDTAWDVPDDDPTARPEEPAPPSASEMAGDSATGGDGIDEPGWD